MSGKELTLTPARSGMANSQAGRAALLCFRVALFRRDEVISLATFAEGRLVLVFGGHLQLGHTIGSALLLWRVAQVQMLLLREIELLRS